MEALSRQDQLVLQAIIPAHMMFLTYEKMTQNGWVIRQDVLKNLNIACVSPFSQLKNQSEWMISAISKRADDVAKVLLRKINENDVRWGLLDCCGFAMLLADEKLLEPDSMSVLVALGLMQECEEDPEAWGYSAKLAAEKGREMLHVAQKDEGLFKPLGQIIPADFSPK